MINKTIKELPQHRLSFLESLFNLHTRIMYNVLPSNCACNNIMATVIYSNYLASKMIPRIISTYVNIWNMFVSTHWKFALSVHLP